MSVQELPILNVLEEQFLQLERTLNGSASEESKAIRKSAFKFEHAYLPDIFDR